MLPQDDGCTFAANKTNNLKKRRNYLNIQKNQKTFGGIKINTYLCNQKNRNYYLIYAYEKEFFTRITDALCMH